jgi:lipopolysaccharide export system protein LptA
MKPHNACSQFACCLLLLWFSTITANAAESSQDEPIRINARSVEANDKTGTVVYRGDVVAEQGRLSIRADRIEIQTRQRKAELVRATGKPVKLRQGSDGESEEFRAEALRVDYHFSQRKIDMIGQVSLWRGEDLFTADLLHYDLISKSLSASGNEQNNGRVHAVIQPRQPKSESTPRL